MLLHTELVSGNEVCTASILTYLGKIILVLCKQKQFTKKKTILLEYSFGVNCLKVFNFKVKQPNWDLKSIYY